MSLDTWFAFLLASIAIVALPGPVVMLTVVKVADGGFRAALPVALGTTLGDALAMTLSLAGLGMFLTASAEAFAVLKIVGAACLLLLGLQAWRTSAGVSEQSAGAPKVSSFWSGFLVTALHPGGFVFFIAFMPLFVDESRPAPPQLAILGVTFLAIAVLNVAGWGLAAGAVRTWLRRPNVNAAMRKAGGGFLIVCGLAAAWSAAGTWRVGSAPA